jgi:hypothetical protein
MGCCGRIMTGMPIRQALTYKDPPIGAGERRRLGHRRFRADQGSLSVSAVALSAKSLAIVAKVLRRVA